MKKIIIISVIIVGLVGLVYFLGQNESYKTENAVINEQSGFYSIKAQYPEEKWDKKEVMEQMVKYIVNMKMEEWKDNGEIYNSEKELSTKFPDRAQTLYQLDISYDATTSPKFKTKTYIFHVYEFTGGAHGNTAVATFTFNKKGQVLIDSILDFNNNKDIEIVRILGRKLLVSLGENSNADTINTGLGLAFLNPDGTLNKEKCHCDGFFFPSNLQNFVIEDNGIRFILGQYQVAPYVVGMPEAVLTWNDLKAYLLKDNPIGI
jgi:hypothetical protein